MPQFLSDGFLQALPNKITECTEYFFCDGYPTSYADVATRALNAAHTLAPGDFSVADGTPDGQAVTVAQQNAVPMTVTGTATYIAMRDTTNTIYAVTELTSGQPVQAGQTLNGKSFTITSRDAQ